MNPNTAIKAVNISKQYRLGEVGTGTLSHDLNRAWARLRGKEDPFLKIGESNDRSTKGESDYVWSLKDINFEIEKGDAVGIIGRNGAGKSTLLKLLSRVTKPTTGHFDVQGRIASLLEVGTGFNPEMTGGENIFLNGAILGMRRNEIKRKFDEIVDFAGVERYIDTPVKRYSSGMYVRLAFAVAAHLESEILIVDEVLAVGDAEFQKKCLGKMGDVSKGEGRTVLFVSHNMAAVQNLCEKGMFLKNGKIAEYGLISAVANSYNNSFYCSGSTIFFSKAQIDASAEAQFIEAEFINNTRDIKAEIVSDVFDDIRVRLKFVVNKYIKGCSPALWIKKQETELYCSFLTDNREDLLFDGMRPGEYYYEVPLPRLKQGTYTISLIFGQLKVRDLHRFENCLIFEVSDLSFDPGIKSYSGQRRGLNYSDFPWINIAAQSNSLIP